MPRVRVKPGYGMKLLTTVAAIILIVAGIFTWQLIEFQHHYGEAEPYVEPIWKLAQQLEESGFSGKPEDEEDARRMIARSCETGLQRVITGVCVMDTNTGEEFTLDETSLVEMAPASEEQISEYVASGEPMGKCGALCIESGQSFVKSWKGSYANIMGLPIEKLLPLLFKLDA